MRLAVVSAVFFSALYVLYRAFIYSSVIFSLRDDCKESVPLQTVP